MAGTLDKRILLLAAPFQSRGSSVYTLRLAQTLPELGYQVQVVSPSTEQLDPERVRKFNILEYPYLNFRLVGPFVRRWVAHDLRENPPDLIHVQTRTMLWEGNWLARTLRRPYIVTIHDYLRPNVRVRLDLRWCRKVITVSESVRRNFLKVTNVPPALVTVIPTGVDVASRPAAEPVLAANRIPVVGTAGPLESIKGVPFFLGAAQRVLQSGRDVEFVVAGSGPDESELRRLSRELGILNHVTFVPGSANFIQALDSMDIFCLPSLQQGLGSIMFEAMLLGKPVIASRVGGVYGAVQDGETGLLVPPSESRPLADRILELLDDPFKARAIGEAARNMVISEFDIKRTAQQTVGVYRETLTQDQATLESSRH